jgi:hypothetical protein
VPVVDQTGRHHHQRTPEFASADEFPQEERLRLRAEPTVAELGKEYLDQCAKLRPGTLLANMLAVSAASGLPAELVLGFVDGEVNRLLDLDTRREVSLCLVPIGRKSERSLLALREAPALGLETIPLSEREVEYPAMLLNPTCLAKLGNRRKFPNFEEMA